MEIPKKAIKFRAGGKKLAGLKNSAVPSKLSGVLDLAD